MGELGDLPFAPAPAHLFIRLVMVGLAAKSAMLIVEFAGAAENEVASRWEAADAEMRQSLGVAVFYGMPGVTLFGLVFTPVIHVVARALTRNGPSPSNPPHAAAGAT